MADEKEKTKSTTKKNGEPTEVTKRKAPTELPVKDAPAAKRGRGRPPKGSKKKKSAYVKKNDPLGRGRPPKNAPKKDAAKKKTD